MSSLGPDDADKQLKQAVPWVSDPQHQDQRDEETRRLQEDVIAAAKRLERESGKLLVQTAVGFRLVRTNDDRLSGEEKARQVWAQLRPEYRLPHQQGFGLPGVAMAAGFLGAMVVSAIVALVVVNVVHRPTISADVSGEERAAKGSSFAAATLGDLAKVSEAQAKMTHTDDQAVSPETVLAAPPSNSAAPKSSAVIAPPPAKLEPDRPEMATPATSPVPAPLAAATATVAPEPRPSPSLSPDEIASLVKRGRDLIALGDIASARLVLTHVAETGDAEASLMLAGTYDPAVLASLRAIGVQGDPAKARAWYAKAAGLGSLEASQRLQALR
jgi:hypothetical protein